MSFGSHVPELGGSIGEALLAPHRSYLRVLQPLLDRQLVKGLAHITGDGLNNLLRLSKTVGYALTDPLPVPPVFGLIAEQGGVSAEEMYEVFNMGLGFAVVVPEADAEAAIELLATHHPGTARIGIVSDEAGEVTHAGAAA